MEEIMYFNWPLVSYAKLQKNAGLLVHSVLSKFKIKHFFKYRCDGKWILANVPDYLSPVQTNVKQIDNYCLFMSSKHLYFILSIKLVVQCTFVMTAQLEN